MGKRMTQEIAALLEIRFPHLFPSTSFEKLVLFFGPQSKTKKAVSGDHKKWLVLSRSAFIPVNCHRSHAPQT